MAIDGFGDDGAGNRTDDARRCKHACASPFHMPGAGMADNIAERAQ